MEATNRNQLFRLLFILFTSVLALYKNDIYAQSTLDSKLTQLLDSAEILKLKSNFYEAVEICNEVKTEAEKTDDWANVARALNELADIGRYYSNYETCQKLLNQSKDVIESYLDTLHVEMASNFFYQGKLQKFMADEEDGYPDNVFASCHKSEAILKKLGNHPKEYAFVMLDLGRFYSQQNSLSQAKGFFNQLERLIDERLAPLDYHRGFHLYYLGEYYNSIADYERAILCMSNARYIFSHPLTLDNNRLLDVEMILGNIYYNTTRFGSAVIHYLNVLEIIENNQIQDYSNVLGVYSNLGRAYYELNNLDSSLLYSKKAYSMNLRKDNEDEETLSRTLLNLGLAHSLEGNYDSAEEYFIKALRLMTQTYGEKNYKVHVLHRNIGNYYGKQNQLDKALDNYQNGLIALFPDFNSRNRHTDPNYHLYERKEDVLYILTDKADALYRRYFSNTNQEDLMAAFRLYTILFELSDDLINSGMMDESMTQLFLGFRTSFNLSIECAFDLYYETGDQKYYKQAYQFIEKSRYILLQKALMNSLYKEYAGISDELFIRERQLDHDINELKYKLTSIKNIDTTFAIRNLLFTKLIEKDNIHDDIESYREVNTVAFKENAMLTLEDIQQELIQDNEIIIEYHWAESFIYALTLEKKDFDVIKIEITDKLAQHINNYSLSISGELDDYFSKQGFQRYVSSAFYIYQKLFEQVLNNRNKPLDKYNEIKQITIVPDGMLSYLPFESLLTDVPDTSSTVSYWNLPYLLNDFTFRYAYSLNILRSNLNTVQKIKAPKLLAFSYSADFENNPEIAQLRSQQEIRYSAEELNSIKSRIKQSELYEDEDATEELFKNQASHYSLIHLALHGQADVTDRYNSKLIFKAGGSPDEDGELFAYELYNMDLSNTEMVVLSACETGIGQQTEGEGIFSIARGFAYAGCPSIFMSLWKVSDKTTAELMDYFYANLKKGLAKDKAMQQAKLKFIEQPGDYKSHPSNWAAFIAMGNNNSIHMTKTWLQRYYFIFGLALIFIILIIAFFRNKRSIFQ